jgi:hypothetical protein
MSYQFSPVCESSENVAYVVHALVHRDKVLSNHFVNKS